MNKKQLIALAMGIVSIVAIGFLTPKYKILEIGPENYIITEQTSSLYKRSQGKEKLHWDKIFIYSSAPLLITGVLLLTLKDKHGKNSV